MDNSNADFGFWDNSTAGFSTIYNGQQDELSFSDNASAGSATITNNGDIRLYGDNDGVTFATAGNAQVTNNNFLEFNDDSSAGNSKSSTPPIVKSYS